MTLVSNAQNHLGFILSPQHLHGFIAAVIAVCGAITVGFLFHTIAFRLLGRSRNKIGAPASPVLHAVAARLRRPALLITMIAAFFVAFWIASPFFGLSARLTAAIEKGLLGGAVSRAGRGAHRGRVLI